MNDLISIILPVYNGQEFLKKSILSCLNQTYQNIEIIVVNDCSTDESLQIASDLQKTDDRIKIINNRQNLNLPASLNEGHKVSKGNFITWTSDDNIYYSNAIESLYTEILRSKSDLVFSHCDVIDEKEEAIGFLNARSHNDLLFRNNVGACFLYTRLIYNQLDGYNERLVLVEDYDFWLRIAKAANINAIPKTLYQYRKHINSLTSLIAEETSSKETFHLNKEQMFRQLAPSAIVNQDLIVLFLSEKENDDQMLKMILEEENFFSDLRRYASSFTAFDEKEVVKITLGWMVEVALKNKHFLNWKFVKYLSEEYKCFILSIAIKRQVALILKCL